MAAHHHLLIFSIKRLQWSKSCFKVEGGEKVEETREGKEVVFGQLLFPSYFSQASISSFFFFVSSKHQIPKYLTIKNHLSFSISVVSTLIAELSQSISSLKPSKTLTFRVRHGFNLHHLEPSKTLIVGGISIRHDRGCEAHSKDGVDGDNEGTENVGGGGYGTKGVGGGGGGGERRERVVMLVVVRKEMVVIT
ncbi:2-C-methyl-D-erythritol 2 4-cyclodiphosphate synthase chloroplastic [Bienertia sinuspersici]